MGPKRLRSLAEAVAVAQSAGGDPAAAAWDDVLAHPLFPQVAKQERAGLLLRAGSAHLERFWSHEEREDADAAVRIFRAASDVLPTNDEHGPAYHHNLGLALQTRFELYGDGDDIAAAIEAFRRALSHPNAAHYGPAIRPHLAQALRQLAAAVNEPVHLDEAVDLLEPPAGASEAADEDGYAALHQLGRALLDRYTWSKDASDLDRAVLHLRHLTELADPQFRDWPAYADHAAAALQRRFEAKGDSADMDAAVELSEAAADAARSHPDRVRLLANLAQALWQQALGKENHDELTRAINLMDRLLGEPNTAPEIRPGLLGNLSGMLLDRYERTGALRDLDRAVEAGQDAVAATARNDSGWAGRCHNLAVALRTRHIRYGRADDLNEAIRLHEQALSAPVTDAIDRPALLTSLANSLRSRHDAAVNAEDLRSARTLYVQALDLLTPDTPERAGVMNNLAAVLAQLSVETDEDTLIDEAAEWASLAVQSSAPGTLEHARAQINLGNALSDKSQRTQNLEVGVRAAAAYRSVLTSPLVAQIGPEAVLQAAVNAGEWAAGTGDWAEADRAYDRATDAVDMLLSAQLLRGEKESWLRPAQGLAARAGFVKARLGQPQLAITVIERGIAVLLAESVELTRLQLPRLTAAGRDDLRRQLEAAIVTVRRAEQGNATQVTLAGSRPEGTAIRASRPQSSRPTGVTDAYAHLNDLLVQVRQVPGFEDFLRQPETAPSADITSLTYLLASPWGGAALQSSKDGIQVIDLPRLTEDAVREHVTALLTTHSRRAEDRRAWLATLDAVCRWEWEILEPLAAELTADQDTSLTIVPVGQLGLLPLHAAWAPDEATALGRRYLCDRFCLRYTPSARALSIPPPDDLPRSVRLLVGPDLGGDVAEHISALADLLPVLAAPELATTADTLHALSAPGVVHLDCHGLAQPDRPLDSALHLADGALTIRDVLEADVRSRMVVLAACETAMSGTDLPDEAVSLPSSLLQAGATAALGSLWAVPAQSTALLMRFFYSAWRDHGVEPAVALRRAQCQLRDATNDELIALAPSLMTTPEGQSALARRLWAGGRPFSGPEHWAGFVCVGL
jgi:CHAT domain-containing protein